MTTSSDQFEKAFSILSQFERQIIEARYFNCLYITDRVEPSKATLWRNIEFRLEFKRVAQLVKGYKDGLTSYRLDKSKESVADAKIRQLKDEVLDLKNQLSRERERLAYASMVARRNNIDPAMFVDGSPMIQIGAENELNCKKTVVVRGKRQSRRLDSAKLVVS